MLSSHLHQSVIFVNTRTRYYWGIYLNSFVTIFIYRDTFQYKAGPAVIDCPHQMVLPAGVLYCRDIFSPHNGGRPQVSFLSLNSALG